MSKREREESPTTSQPSPEPTVTARKRHVAKGRAFNSLDQESEFLAFVGAIDGEEAEAWRVRLEFVSREWMDGVWVELLKTDLGLEFFKLLDGRDFADVWPGLSDAQREVAYLLFLWFAGRVLDEDGEHAGRAPTAFFDVYLQPGDPLRHALREGTWYYADLEEPDPDPNKVLHLGVLHTLGETPQEDTLSRKRLVAESFAPVEKASRQQRIMQAALHALHFPQGMPRPPPGETRGPRSGSGSGGSGPGPRGGDEAEGSLPLPWGEDMVVERPPGIDAPPLQPPILVRAARALRDSLTPMSRFARRAAECGWAWLEDLFPPGPLGLQPALAGVPGAFFPAREPGRGALGARPRPPALAYIGSPDAAAGNPGNNPWNDPTGAAAQARNPLVQDNNSQRQPFVGVLDVGQGSCNVLVDDQHHAIAYFDFGYPTGEHAGAPPAQGPTPCLCHDPLIILSHWDSDHWGLCRRVPDAYRLEWIAPQQHLGTPEVETIARVLTRGGRMYLWQADGGPGCHMRFPWGYLERQTGNNPLSGGKRNITGLVAYVCVRDQKGTDPNAGANPAVPYDHTAGAPNVPRVGGGGNAAGLVRVALAAPTPLNWPAAFLWPAFQAESAAYSAGLNAARAASAQVPAVTANGDRKRELAALVALCMRADDAHTQSGLPTAQQCANLACEVIDAYTYLRANGAATIPASARLRVNATNANALNNAGAVASDYALMMGQVSDHAAASGHSGGQRRQALCATGGQRLRGRVGGWAQALSLLGIDSNTDSDAVRRRELFSALHSLMKAGVRAGPPINPTGRIPHVLAGQAPFSPNENYVLITGDGDFGVMPSQLQTPSPVVVGLVAAHHGSKQMDNRQLTASCIPFAPLSDSARAARAARASVNNGDTLGLVTREAGWPLSTTLATQGDGAASAAQVGRAAEELLHAMGTGLTNPFNHTPSNRKAMGAAAAAAVMAYRVAAAANLAAATRRVAVVTAALVAFEHCEEASPLSVAHAAVTAAHSSETAINGLLAPANYTFNTATEYAAAAAVTAQLGGNPFWVNPATEALADLLGKVVVHASMSTSPHFQPYYFCQGLTQGPRTVVAIHGANAALGAFLDGVLANVVNAENGTLAAVAAPAVGQAGPPATWRQWAAAFGAECGVATRYACNPMVLHAAVDAAYAQREPPAVQASVGAAWGGRIAYSYGIQGAGWHCYPAAPGAFGHPHPFALQKYQARGWTARRNTADTRNSRQPDPSPWGPVALGWKDEALTQAGAYEGPLTQDTYPVAQGGGPVTLNNSPALRWTCATCPVQIDRFVI